MDALRHRFFDDLDIVLADKTSDKAADRVKMGDSHGGVAYLMLLQWFTRITGTFPQKEFRNILSPSPVGKDSNLLNQLEG